MSGFAGFAETALDFYDDLEMDNTRSFWQAHQQVYADAVRAPMLALTEALEPEFGVAKIFRPYRDVRFSKDKTPYKTAQGAFVAAGPTTGWYVQIGAPGVFVGAGFYRPGSGQLGVLRGAIDDERRGRQLEKLVGSLRRRGFEIGGERLKTSPRGYDAEHPRIDLLRHKSLVARRDYGFEPVIHSADLVAQVRDDWRRLRPLVEWVAGIVG